MPTTEMALRIEPENELKFRGPFTSPVTSILKLTNSSDKRVIFKIKTTAPKRYCVRPNAGIIEPAANLSIAVVLQPCELEQSANRHKFMVQAIYAPSGEINQDELWRNSQNVMETKLRCHFEHPDQGQANEAAVAVEEKPTRHVHTETKAVAPVHQQPHREEQAAPQNDDERRLKRENKELKDEIERLRRKLKSNIQSGESMMNTGTASPPSQTMAMIVGAIIIAMLSLIIGKFVL